MCLPVKDFSGGVPLALADPTEMFERGCFWRKNIAPVDPGGYYFTHEILHPRRQRRQAFREIGGDNTSLVLVGEDRAQPSQNAPPIIRVGQNAPQPVKRLDKPALPADRPRTAC